MGMQGICGKRLPCFPRDAFQRHRRLFSYWGLAAGSPWAPKPQWVTLVYVPALAHSLVLRHAVSEVITSSTCPGKVGKWHHCHHFLPVADWLQLLFSWIRSLQQHTATTLEVTTAVAPQKFLHNFHPGHSLPRAMRTGLWVGPLQVLQSPIGLVSEAREVDFGYKGLYNIPTQPPQSWGNGTRF